MMENKKKMFETTIHLQVQLTLNPTVSLVLNHNLAAIRLYSNPQIQMEIMEETPSNFRKCSIFFGGSQQIRFPLSPTVSLQFKILNYNLVKVFRPIFEATKIQPCGHVALNCKRWSYQMQIKCGLSQTKTMEVISARIGCDRSHKHATVNQSDHGISPLLFSKQSHPVT